MSSSRCYSLIQRVTVGRMWTIEDVGSMEFMSGEELFCRIIEGQSNELEWNLQLFPNGVDNSCQGWMSLFLSLVKGPETGVQVKGKMSIVNSDCRDLVVGHFHKMLHPGERYGFRQFKRWVDVVDEDYGHLQDGNLHIACKMNVLLDSVNTMRQNVLVPKCSMQADFRKLLEDPLFSDCSLWAAGEEIKAHKAILSARCPVFKAMFSQDMKERRTNRFDIHDMDPEVLKEIVYFIYTGDAPNLPEMASKVIAAADMYLLETLKAKCEEALCSSLSVENAAELLILGDLHRAHQLRTDAISFINSNASEVLKTSGWKTLVASHPKLMVDLFCSMSSPGKPPTKRLRCS